MDSKTEILCINSEKEELKRVEKFLFHFFERNELPQKHFNKVFLCISEAVINGIEHGNKCDREKEVSIQIRRENNDLLMEIKDEGKGFDHTCLEDPTNKKNLKRESGRGIHIMKSISNRLDYHEEGRLLKLKICLK
jgi:serine/threonine-protein kinase RsbW